MKNPHAYIIIALIISGIAILESNAPDSVAVLYIIFAVSYMASFLFVNMKTK